MLGLTPLRLRWPCGVDRQKAVRFGKSKIHRWGVFAAEALRKDDMLLEYRGGGDRQCRGRDTREGETHIQRQAAAAKASEK